MLGVVVWSNETRSKAVIWCEDQGALAYLEGVGNLALSVAWPNAGDLVELDCAPDGGLRLARNVRVLSQGVGEALPRALRARAVRADAVAAEAVMPAADLSHLRLVSDRAIPDGSLPAAVARTAAVARNCS